jgi:hypothetical protein
VCVLKFNGEAFDVFVRRSRRPSLLGISPQLGVARAGQTHRANFRLHEEWCVPGCSRVWLGEEPADASELKALLAPFPSEEMTCWPVNSRVGNVKNNDPSLIEPIAA